MSHTMPMSVENTAFLIDRLGRDCAPLQYLRELTQNSIEAILRTPEKSGSITWDIDWVHAELEGIYKLTIVDTGDGMSGDDMVHYINHLSSSIAAQSFTGNFGVGAKIAALTKNPSGLVYLSWKHGSSAMTHLWRDDVSHEYGLKQYQLASGLYSHWVSVDDEAKPPQIHDHGTMVVLLGESDEQHTAVAPAHVKTHRQHWISRYLNKRYFQFPDGIEVKVREFSSTDPSDWPVEETRRMAEGAQLRTVRGQKYILDRFAQDQGSVRLTGAIAHWWLLRDDRGLTDQNRYWQTSGHMAALYQDELYEMADGRGGVRLLQQFGCVFGHRRVVIYVEPADDSHILTADTARARLHMDGDPLPWAEWSDEFRAALPTPIRELQEEVLANTEGKDYTEAIKERLKAISDLFKLSRYRRTNTGELLVQGDGSGGEPREQGSTKQQGGNRGGAGGLGGNLYGLFVADEGDRASAVNTGLQIPDTQWITVKDGTRSEGDLEDRAARYIRDQNRLLINGDFRLFTDMIDHWAELYSSVPGAPEVIPDVVREWFQQQLVETILGVLALEGSREWSSEDIERTYSEEALTASVMPRYHVENQIKRALGTVFGSLKA